MDGLIQKHGEITVKYYYYPDGGTAKSRNYGIARSSGDVIVFVDDDVLLHQAYTTEIVKYFSNNTDVYGVTGPIYDRVEILRYGLSDFEMGNLKNNGGLFFEIIRNDIESYSGLEFIEFYRRYRYTRHIRKIIRMGKIFFFLDSLRAGKATASGFANSLPALDKPYPTRGVHGCNMAFKREVFENFQIDEYLEKKLHYAIYEDHEFAYRVSKKYLINMVPTIALYHRKTPTSRIRYDELFEAIVVNIYYLVKKDMDSVFHKIAFAWSVFGILCTLCAVRIFSPGRESKDKLNGVIKGIKDIIINQA